ncbi:hypothetical protein LA080_011098 [Diaporthe eres]|nr:hypothetical protein LA080_011098 [Diaporthe eres]
MCPEQILRNLASSSLNRTLVGFRQRRPLASINPIDDVTRTEIWIIGARPSIPRLTQGSNCLRLDVPSSSHLQPPAAATCGDHYNLVWPHQVQLSELLCLLESSPPCTRCAQEKFAVEQLLRMIQTLHSAKRTLLPATTWHRRLGPPSALCHALPRPPVQFGLWRRGRAATSQASSSLRRQWSLDHGAASDPKHTLALRNSTCVRFRRRDRADFPCTVFDRADLFSSGSVNMWLLTDHHIRPTWTLDVPSRASESRKRNWTVDLQRLAEVLPRSALWHGRGCIAAFSPKAVLVFMFRSSTTSDTSVWLVVSSILTKIICLNSLVSSNSRPVLVGNWTGSTKSGTAVVLGRLAPLRCSSYPRALAGRVFTHCRLPQAPESRRDGENMLRSRGLTLGPRYHYATATLTTLRKAHDSTLGQTGRYIALITRIRLSKIVTFPWRGCGPILPSISSSAQRPAGPPI